MIKASRSQRGFSLVEVVIALMLLAIGLTGAMATVLQSSKGLAVAGHIDQGTVLAQSLLSALMAAPSSGTAGGQGGTSCAGSKLLIANCSLSNDADITDTAKVFVQPTLPAGSFDHSDAELAGTPLQAVVVPLPANPAFERYWNVAPLPNGLPGVSLAVIVRWSEGPVWRRTVLVGTR